MSAPLAVLFDLGNVLCTVDLGRLRAAWETQTGAPYEALERSLFGSGIKEAMDRGRVDSAEAVERICRDTGVSLDVSSFEAIWNTVIGPWPAANALALCLTVPMGLLSNTDAVHHAHARTLCPALAAMGPHVVSYRVGALKPEADIYQAAITAMGVPAGEILFLDDLAPNVEAARVAGLQAVQVRDVADMERALEGALGRRP